MSTSKLLLTMQFVVVILASTLSVGFSFSRQKYQVGSPEEAAESLMYGDYNTMYRDSDLHYSIGSYRYIPASAVDGVRSQCGEAWYDPAIIAYIDSYNILGLLQKSKVRHFGEEYERAEVAVRVMIYGFRFTEINADAPVFRLYAWSKLAIADCDNKPHCNVQFDYTNRSSFLSEMRSLGEAVPASDSYVKVKRGRRLWRFSIFVERNGKGGAWRAATPFFPVHVSLVLAAKEKERQLKRESVIAQQLCTAKKFEAHYGRTCEGQLLILKSLETAVQALEYIHN